MTHTLSRRPLRRFWGWGHADATLSAQELSTLGLMLSQLDVGGPLRPEPQLHEFTLAPSRVQPPAALAHLFSATPLDRLNHSAGKSFADCARMWLRQPPPAPDWVVYPDNEQDVVDVLDWAVRHNVAVIPYGGGSSVCGGVEVAVGGGYTAAISLDMERMHRVLEVDPVSRAARVQAGALGPELAAQLKTHGLALRHFQENKKNK